jgi:hypothetical protein
MTQKINTVAAQKGMVYEFIHDVVPGEYDRTELYRVYASSTFAPPVTSQKIFDNCMGLLQREGCTRNLFRIVRNGRPVMWYIR